MFIQHIRDEAVATLSADDKKTFASLLKPAEDAAHHVWAGSESGLVVSERPLEAYGPGQRVRFVAGVGDVALTKKRIRRNYLAVGVCLQAWKALLARNRRRTPDTRRWPRGGHRCA